MGTTNKSSCKTAAVMNLLSRSAAPVPKLGTTDVSELDTTGDPIPAREQIEYIDIDRIDDDPNNFYELSNLDELAANIELLGLQQPIRVRPGEAPGRYIIVSGHRRRAAVQMLVMDGHGELRDLPCIVERNEESPAMRELRLIMANSDTRKLSSAEIGKQAERVETLLYQLQEEEGVEFPGRMRDHVAEACKVSKSKLARLKVIREKLAGSWRPPYDDGRLPEATAYTLAQMPGERQQVIWDGLAKRGDGPASAREYVVRSYGEKLAQAEAVECETYGHGPCLNRDRMQERIMSQDCCKYNYCTQCCEKCEKLTSCGRACQLLADKVERLKADAKAQKQQEAQTKEARERLETGQIRALWKRFGEARTAAGKSVMQFFAAAKLNLSEEDAAEYEEMERLEVKFDPCGDLPYGYCLDIDDVHGLVAAADLFGVSLDYLLCRTDDPAGIYQNRAPTEAPRSCAQEPAPMPEGQLAFNGWMPGGTLPRTPCDVVADFDMGTNHPIRLVCCFDGKAFRYRGSGGAIDAKVVRWMMLPPVSEEGCGDGDA